jgi:hypothetical protein
MKNISEYTLFEKVEFEFLGTNKIGFITKIDVVDKRRLRPNA